MGGSGVIATDQMNSFNDRVKRISAGRQYEHEDIVGHQTQTAWNRRAAHSARRPKRTFADRIMKWVALAAGAGSVMAGKLAYFHAAQIEGLPKAFYDLGGRGVLLATFVIAATLAMVLRLGVRGRAGMLILGVAGMYYGEGLVALARPDLWSMLFSPDYAASAAESGRAILQTAG